MKKKEMESLIFRLTMALQHCQDRLNQIPHQYMDTNFKLIRELKKENEP